MRQGCGVHYVPGSSLVSVEKEKQTQKEGLFSSKPREGPKGAVS